MAMVGYVYLWVFMRVYGYLGRVCGDVYRRLWKFMGVYEYLVIDLCGSWVYIF